MTPSRVVLSPVLGGNAAWVTGPWWWLFCQLIAWARIVLIAGREERIVLGACGGGTILVLSA